MTTTTQPDTRTELEKDAANLLFALHDAWGYVHRSCTIEPIRDRILALMRKHGDFADLHPPHATSPGPTIELLDQFVSLFDESVALMAEQAKSVGLTHVTLHGPSGDLMFRLKQVADSARALIARRVQPTTPHAEFEVWQGAEMVASTSGPRAEAYTEAQNYAAQYQLDGPVSINEVVRVPVLRASGPLSVPLNKDESYPLKARVFRRHMPDEWVLEIEGMIGTCHVTSRHTQPLHLAPEDVPGLPSRHGTIDSLGEDDINEIAEKFATRDYLHDYPATVYDIVREVERRLQEQ